MCFAFSDAYFEEILRLSRAYYCEAKKCEKAGAFLAGCIMIGASFEAILLAFANTHIDEVIRSDSAPKKKGKVKPLKKWSLNDLLEVADKCNWLPRGLSNDEDWHRTRAKIGDYGEIIKRMRNLVHPAKYASDMPGKRITKRYLQSLFEIIGVASDHLLNKIYEEIREELKEDE